MQADQAHQDVGEYRGVKKSSEVRHATPAAPAAPEAEAAFQIGNARFDARPESPQSMVQP